MTENHLSFVNQLLMLFLGPSNTEHLTVGHQSDCAGGTVHHNLDPLCHRGGQAQWQSIVMKGYIWNCVKKAQVDYINIPDVHGIYLCCTNTFPSAHTYDIMGWKQKGITYLQEKIQAQFTDGLA